MNVYMFIGKILVAINDFKLRLINKCSNPSKSITVVTTSDAETPPEKPRTGGGINP